VAQQPRWGVLDNYMNIMDVAEGETLFGELAMLVESYTFEGERSAFVI